MPRFIFPPLVWIECRSSRSRLPGQMSEQIILNGFLCGALCLPISWYVSLQIVPSWQSYWFAWSRWSPFFATWTGVNVFWIRPSPINCQDIEASDTALYDCWTLQWNDFRYLCSSPSPGSRVHAKSCLLPAWSLLHWCHVSSFQCQLEGGTTDLPRRRLSRNKSQTQAPPRYASSPIMHSLVSPQIIPT